MNNQEKNNFGNKNEAFDEKALEAHSKEHRERLREDRERAAEKSHETSADDARKEALEQASKIEKQEQEQRSKETSPAERRGPITKRERKDAFDATMRDVRSQMSGPSRTFSQVIHNPAVEKVSEVVGGTIARPNAILAGAVSASVLALVVYVIARYYGYPLSGTETIASFGLGWILGNVFDYFRVLISGRSR